MSYKHIELRKLFVLLNSKSKYEGTPVEIDIVVTTYRLFKDTTAYKRSIRGRINAKQATTIKDLRKGIIQAAREMTKYYSKFS